MKYVSSGLLSMVLGVAMMLTLSACIFENPAEEGPQEPQETRFIFRIGAVGTPSTTPTSYAELLESLRIIIIDDEGHLEVNEKIDLPVSEEASRFIYTYNSYISSGKKSVFLVGNERSVGEVMLTDATDVPSKMPLSSLTALLDYFTPSDQRKDGTTLKAVMNRLYFKNDYNSVTDGTNIYLPYTANYEIDVTFHTTFEKTLYLVPAATKFDFCFINYRRHNAQIDDVVLSAFNSHNFLNAQLPGGSLYRQLDEQNVWWIDWLNACASASQETDDNPTFNELWGWIDNYYVPVPSEALTNVSLNPDKKDWIIDALVDKSNPSKIYVGPYYLPESIRMVTTVDDDGKPLTKQSYTMTFYVHDELEEEVTVLANYEIDNLPALFRATHVIVEVVMYEQEVEIYAEIAPWNPVHFWGYVQQDDNFY